MRRIKFSAFDVQVSKDWKKILLKNFIKEEKIFLIFFSPWENPLQKPTIF